MNVQLVLLGTGTPNADPERSGPAVAVIAGERAYLVDAGPGVVRSAARAARSGIGQLEPDRLGWVFLTHLHSDHTAGLPDLLLTPWVLGRSDPLRVFGPTGTAAMLEHLQAAYREDVRQRREGLEPAPPTGWGAQVQEIDSGLAHEEGSLRVEAFAVEHGSWPAFGYKFTTPERSIVISGDTAPSAAVAEAAAGCDLLVHEVYSGQGLAARPAEWQRYHRRMHTSAAQLGALARRARPKLIVLYHQLLWGVSEEELLAEVAAHYDGPVRSGRDLDVY